MFNSSHKQEFDVSDSRNIF